MELATGVVNGELPGDGGALLVARGLPGRDLGDQRVAVADAPNQDANELHQWALDGAQSLWQSGHYHEAVRAAAFKVNAKTQNKLTPGADRATRLACSDR